jgi:hypothetical protein
MTGFGFGSLYFGTMRDDCCSVVFLGRGLSVRASRLDISRGECIPLVDPKQRVIFDQASIAEIGANPSDIGTVPCAWLFDVHKRALSPHDFSMHYFPASAFPHTWIRYGEWVGGPV